MDVVVSAAYEVVCFAECVVVVVSAEDVVVVVGDGVSLAVIVVVMSEVSFTLPTASEVTLRALAVVVLSLA